MADDCLYDETDVGVLIDERGRWLVKPKGQPRWEFIGRLLEDLPHAVGAEIGVQTGTTSLYLLRKLPALRRLYCIDPWQKRQGVHEWKRGNEARAAMLEFMLESEPLMDRIVLLRKMSDEAEFDIPLSSLDWIFIDGMHTYEAVKRDIALAQLWVRPGGVIIGHDYLSRMKRWAVKRAVLEVWPEGQVQFGPARVWYVVNDRCQKPGVRVQRIEATRPPVVSDVCDLATDSGVPRLLWWCNGGIGDAVMMAPAMAALTAERTKAEVKKGIRRFEVDFFPQRAAARLAGDLIGKIPGVNVVDQKPVAGRMIGVQKNPGKNIIEPRAYHAVCCDCPLKTLQERAEAVECACLVNPRSWKGSPADWGLDIARQLRPGVNLGAPVLAGLLPHMRRPEVVVFGPGVGGNEKNQLKRWSADDADCTENCKRWVQLLGELHADIPVAFIGAADALSWLPRNMDDSSVWGRVDDQIGKTETLVDLLPVFARAALYVGVDNGLGHMAAELGVPTLTIFGPTDPMRYAPRGHNAAIVGGVRGEFPSVEEVAAWITAFLSADGTDNIG